MVSEITNPYPPLAISTVPMMYPPFGFKPEFSDDISSRASFSFSSYSTSVISFFSAGIGNQQLTLPSVCNYKLLFGCVEKTAKMLFDNSFLLIPLNLYFAFFCHLILNIWKRYESFAKLPEKRK